MEGRAVRMGMGTIILLRNFSTISKSSLPVMLRMRPSLKRLAGCENFFSGYTVTTAKSPEGLTNINTAFNMRKSI